MSLAEQNATFGIAFDIALVEEQPRMAGDACYLIRLIATSMINSPSAEITSGRDLDELGAMGTVLDEWVGALKGYNPRGKAVREKNTEGTLSLDGHADKFKIRRPFSPAPRRSVRIMPPFGTWVDGYPPPNNYTPSTYQSRAQCF